MIKVIEPGRYTIRRDGSPHVCSLEWWNEVNDFVRRRAVSEALNLPAEIVELGLDTDEEVDLASVWLVTDDREEAIGHVTTDPDGTIVVEILYDGYLVVEYDTEPDPDTEIEYA